MPANNYNLPVFQTFLKKYLVSYAATATQNKTTIIKIKMGRLALAPHFLLFF